MGHEPRRLSMHRDSELIAHSSQLKGDHMRPYLPLLLLLTAALAGCGSPSSGSSSNPTPSSSISAAQNHVHSIVILPNNPNELYLGAHYKLYKSNDGGRKWHPLTRQMMLSMAMDPAHPSTLYAVSLQRGLVKTTDGGVHWASTEAGIPHGKVTGVAFDPADKAVLAYGLGIYRSVDGGAHWSHVLTSGQIRSVAAGADGTACAATDNGLYVSHDGGVHWKLVASVGNQPVIQVAASEGVAYAVAAVALFKSSNGGRSWKPLPKAATGIEFIGVSPSDPREIIAEVANQGFVASHDGGATWHAANGIHDTNFNASTVRVAPSSPNVAYTGSWGIHFYASHDGGRHWSKTSTLLH